MPYLFGDSTESKLDFDYLAFLREVIDCAVVMLECEVALATIVERWRTRQAETAAVAAAVDEFGSRATLLVGPVAQDQAGTPVGRCAASVAAAIKEAVDRESSRVQGILAGERTALDQEEQRVRARAKDALERLLRTHDLPDADKEFEVGWTGPSVKASLRERTSFGLEALLALDVPASSVLVPDLRVDRVADGVEVHSRDGGGWLKKSDKLVAHKLGRHHVAGVTVVGAQVTVRLRAADAGAAGLTITAHRDGELAIETVGGGAELVIDDRARPALRLFVDKLEAAVRALGDHRGGLASVEIDGKPLAEYGHPRTLAERFMVAIAPTVHRIARHSRSPGELVLRRLLGDNRREEIFVSVAELVRRFQGLPADLRDVFAPLQLEGDPPPAHEPKPPAAPPAAVVDDVRPPPSRTTPPVSTSEPRRAPSRTTPPIPGLDKQRPLVPMPDPRSVPRPLSPARTGDLPPEDPEFFDDDAPTVMQSVVVAMPTPPVTASGTPAPIASPAPVFDRPSAPLIDPLARKRADDAALSRAIDSAIDADEEAPSAK